jgi:diguanylate cyclase (GGDEF)-like protein
MSSREKTPSKAVVTRSNRPILWVGGRGLPGGAIGSKLVALGYPLYWEPSSGQAARAVATLQPALVVIESEKVTDSLREFLFTITELKSTIDMVAFQLRKSEPRVPVDGIDGTFLKGNGLILQIKAALAVIEGSKVFKSAGIRAQKRIGKVRAEVDRLRTLAVSDDLTCLYNLRFFNRSLETEHQRATRFGRHYTLIFVDLDGLREVNARRGHLAGGQVLKNVGEFIKGCIRQIDLPARIGGDEFVIICPETAKSAARLVADRLRHGIQRLRDARGKSLGITASIGVASFPEDGDLPGEVLQRADRALYEAKALGKNRVCCWGEFVTADNEKHLLGSVHNTDDATPIEPTKKKPTVN